MALVQSGAMTCQSHWTEVCPPEIPYPQGTPAGSDPLLADACKAECAAEAARIKEWHRQAAEAARAEMKNQAAEAVQAAEAARAEQAAEQPTGSPDPLTATSAEDFLKAVQRQNHSNND